MSGKRFTYWTSDGKRHWTPLFDPPIILDLSESAKIRRADKFYVFHTQGRKSRVASREAARLRRALAR
jgi:hypothetical protein